jgi:3-oxoacyl-[acyl-carrier-protein] synthase II
MESRRAEIKTVHITEARVITSLGDSLEGTWNAAMKGKRGMGPIGRFSAEAYEGQIAALINDLTWIDKRSIINELLDRLLSGIQTLPPDTALITATTKLGIDNLERQRRGEHVHIGDILSSSMPQMVSQKLGIKKRGFNISASCASSTIAIAEASAMIATGMSETVLICCADVITEFIFSGFSALKIVSPSACRPFDRDRKGITLGDGAAMLLLMSGERAKREGRRALAVVRGWGVANDAFHITSPVEDGSGLVAAISKALRRAGLAADDVQAISAHGTGTTYNDLMELKAFNQVFRGRKLPAYSIKGSIGHTLGAAGGIEVALATRALEEQTIPPTVGFENPEEGAEGLISSKPALFKGDYIMTSNSGFGGINAVVILEKVGKEQKGQ